MLHSLLKYTRVLEIVGDTIKVRVPSKGADDAPVRYNDLAIIETVDGHKSMAQAIFIDGDVVTPAGVLWHQRNFYRSDRHISRTSDARALFKQYSWPRF